MYQLLKDPVLQSGGDMIFPEFRRVRDGLNFSIRKIKEYRRINPRYLPGGHLLLRLLGSITVSQRHDPIQYNDRVTDLGLQIGQSFNLTSSLSRGRVFRPGPFLGGNVTEVIIANVDQWDVEEGIRNWEELTPIRFLSHPMSTLKMPVPDAQFASAEAGLAVITINIPMLASQYRMWRLKFQVGDESPRTLAQFLQAYPIPNMLDSQVDLAILNRVFNRYFNIEPLGEPFRHPYYLIDWTQQVDQVVDRFMKAVGPKRWDFDTLVSHIPTVSSENLHHTIALPEMPYSTQLQWAVLLARLPLITFLVQFNHSTENNRNQAYLNYIKRWLAYMDGNRTLHNALHSDLLEDTMILIDQGIRPYL